MNNPRVGVGVIVVKEGKVLLGKRKNSHGDGTYHFPGGHLEFGESWEKCAAREVEEETGLKITNLRYASTTNDIFYKEGKHYITIFVIADHLSGDPEVREPEKCEKWEWISWDALPQPLFLPIENLLRQGYNPFN